MPELPEVETVRRGLTLHFDKLPLLDRRLLSVERSDKELRFKFPSNILVALKDLRLLSIERRAKYLLFNFGEKILINHLGMTGSWRKISELKLELHDHVAFRFSPDLILVYRDPRRFGYFDLIDQATWQQSRWFSHLGPEPLEGKFNSEYLFAKTRNKTAPLKSFMIGRAHV